MKDLKTGHETIQRISDLLLQETLIPAKKEAELLIQEASDRAKRMVHEAEETCRKNFQEYQQKIALEENVFRASLLQSVNQSVEALKQKVEQKLFKPMLGTLIDQELQKPEVIADLIAAIVQAIQKEGLSTDIAALIPVHAKVDEINALLTQNVLQNLRRASVMIGSATSGVEVKLLDKKITIDMTGKAMQEIVTNFIRKDLRDFIFVQEENR